MYEKLVPVFAVLALIGLFTQWKVYLSIAAPRNESKVACTGDTCSFRDLVVDQGRFLFYGTLPKQEFRYLIHQVPDHGLPRTTMRRAERTVYLASLIEHNGLEQVWRVFQIVPPGSLLVIHFRHLEFPLDDDKWKVLPFHLMTLREFLDKSSPHVISNVEFLSMETMRNQEISEATVRAYRDLVVAGTAPVLPKKRRIGVRRETGFLHAFENHDTVVFTVRAHFPEYDVLEIPTNLTWTETVAMYQSLDILVSPAGDGATYASFMRNDTALVIGSECLGPRGQQMWNTIRYLAVYMMDCDLYVYQVIVNNSYHSYYVSDEQVTRMIEMFLF